MKIGINAMVLMKNKTGGMETYLVKLLKNLSKIDKKNIYYIFGNKNKIKKKTKITSSNFKFINLNSNNIIKRVFIEQIIIPYYYNNLNLDILLFPGNIGQFIKRGKSIVVLHDLLVKRYPENINFFRKLYYKIFLPLGLKNADHIITISDFAKKEMDSFFDLNKNQTTIYHGINFNDNDFSGIKDDSWKKTNDYILYVGSISPHKNIKKLIKAFNILNKKNQNIKLVLVGKRNENYKIDDLIKKLNLEEDIIVTGFVSNKDLHEYYKYANLFAFPSLYEGFGLPLFEAMYYNIPVVCSNSACLPEIANEAAIFFNPNDQKDIADKIMNVLNNKELQKHLIQKGNSRIKDFTWIKTAEETLKVMESVVKN